jgi:hypothetical protein
VKQTIGLLFCLAWGFAAMAQDLSGRWTGYQLQNPGGMFEKYYWELNIVQQGDRVLGTSFCSVEEVSIKMKFVGKIKGSQLFFEEIEYLGDPKIPAYNAEWCRLKGGGKITTDGDKLFIIGTYRGTASFGECIPGSFYLEKKAKRA